MSLVSLQQKIVKKPEKLIKTVNIENEENLISAWLEQFQWKFQEKCDLWWY